jgi:hypothetical protein
VFGVLGKSNVQFPAGVKPIIGSQAAALPRLMLNAALSEFGLGVVGAVGTLITILVFLHGRCSKAPNQTQNQEPKTTAEMAQSQPLRPNLP